MCRILATTMTPRVTKNMGESLRAAGALSTVGLSFVLALGIGFWLGTVLDRWLGTSPLFAIVCFFLGLAAGVLNVYRIVSQAFPPRSQTQSGPTQSSPTQPAGPTEPGPTDCDLYDDRDR